jgi:hypothetical protein
MKNTKMRKTKFSATFVLRFIVMHASTPKRRILKILRKKSKQICKFSVHPCCRLRCRMMLKILLLSAGLIKRSIKLRLKTYRSQRKRMMELLHAKHLDNG